MRREDDRSIIPLFDDAFSSVVRKVCVQSVFASRVLLDILDLCGKGFKGQEIMRTEGDRAQNTFGFFVDAAGGIDVGGGVRWLSKNNKLIMEIYNRIDMHLRKPTFSMAKEMLLETEPEDYGEADEPESQVIVQRNMQRLAQDPRMKDRVLQPPSPRHCAVERANLSQTCRRSRLKRTIKLRHYLNQSR